MTVAQKHPFVDSVTRAGILLSYWENEEPAVKSSFLHVPETTDDLKLSPVYSLAVQNQSLWLLSGLEVYPLTSFKLTKLDLTYVERWYKPSIRSA